MSSVKEDEVINTFNDVKTKLLEHFNAIKAQVMADSEIDEVSLDYASLSTAKLLSKYGTLYSDEYLTLSDLKDRQKKYKLERWKYYSGKQTSKYYADFGAMHEEINRGDLEKYLDADPIMVAVNKVVDIQTAIVSLLDKTSKELNGRNYQIKTALDYRKFVSGV